MQYFFGQLPAVKCVRLLPVAHRQGSGKRAETQMTDTIKPQGSP